MKWNVEVEENRKTGMIDFSVWRHVKAEGDEEYDLAHEEAAGDAPNVREAFRLASRYIEGVLSKGGSDT